ncbi:MAG: hypothetical protein HZB53_05475 [Chloroflexi bacterium]|nr:hypothetical protein [Chloroflexota bacterium]
MKRGVLIGSAAFGVTLALLVSQRLSEQAMAVIVGSVIGVVASVPMTAVVLWLMLRTRMPVEAPPARHEYAPREEQPRIMVIQPQSYLAAPTPLPSPASAYMPSAAMGMPRSTRDFKIVGEADLDDEETIV